MTFDLRLKENFKIFLSGPSGSGKTSFIIKLIENIDNVAKFPPRKIVYYYTEWQEKFNGMRKNFNVTFIEDNEMILDQVKDIESPALIIFDDMLNSPNLKAIAQLFTVHGRHMNLCLAFLSQRLFNKNEYFRQISQNSDYMCIFKNPRNSMDVRNMAMQITPKTLDLLHIYTQATKKPYSYIFIDLTQECIPQFRYRSGIFDDEHLFRIYVLNNCK